MSSKWQEQKYKRFVSLMNSEQICHLMNGNLTADSHNL